MRRLSSTLALSLLVALPACKKSGTTSESNIPEASKAKATAEAPPQTLTPVAAPENVMMQMRIESVSGMFDQAVAAWGEPYDWRKKLEEADGAEDEIRFEHFDLDASFDMISTIDATLPGDEGIYLAVGIGVRSLDDVRVAMEKAGPVRSLAGGVFRARPDEQGDDFLCEIGPSRGATAARLVCGRGEASLDALGPYLRRGDIDALPGKGDFAITVDAEPFREPFRAQVTEGLQQAGMVGSMGVAGLQDEDFRDAAATSLRAILDEAANLYEDLGSITIEGSLGGPQGGLMMATSVQMLGQKSFISRALTGHEDVMAPAPADFWALPATMDSASFSHARVHDETRAIGAMAGRLLVGGAKELGYPHKKLQKAVDLYADVASKYTEGSALAVGRAATGAAVDPNWPDELTSAFTDMAITLIGSSYQADMSKAMKAFVGAYNDKAMQKKLKELLSDGKSLPKIKFAKASAKTKLPKGSYELSIKLPKDWLPKDSKIKTMPSMSIFMSPIGDRMWTGFSGDRDGTIAALRELTAKPAKTMADVPEAQRFRDQKVQTGGWMTLGGSFFTRILDELADEADSDVERDLYVKTKKAWLDKYAAKDLPGIVSWTSTQDMRWRGEVLMGRESLAALADLFATIVKEGSEAGGEATTPMVVEEIKEVAPPAKKLKTKGK